MPFQCVTENGPVSFDEIPLPVFQGIADRYEMTWLEVYESPVLNVGAAVDLYQWCCDHTGSTPVTPFTAPVAETVYTLTRTPAEASPGDEPEGD